MSLTVIKIEDVGKLYRLGDVGTGTVSHDLNRWFARIRGKEDPFAKIGEVNDRTKKGTSDYVWALKDISFEVQQGEAVGIIGRNGAGKSTLLKLLSKVTPPTTGNIKVKGRIASLLEVGTGFHPELNGRENIYLNGAILGMTKREITRKFDEIVDFAGVERYIDTPVKRYSSGMYVRLAFAVAAYLESEVLIVDEVLAVGDAEFQRKCLGKMGDVTKKEGRTVLFVSHNMASIKNLCQSAILLKHGGIVMQGPTAAVIDRYASGNGDSERHKAWENEDRPRFEELEVNSISILDGKGRIDSLLMTSDNLSVEINYTVKKSIRDLRVSISLYTSDEIEIFSSSDFDAFGDDRNREPGIFKSVCYIPDNFLNTGVYILKVHFDVPRIKSFILDIPVRFTIAEMIANQLGASSAARPGGIVHPLLKWKVSKESLIDYAV